MTGLNKLLNGYGGNKLLDRFFRPAPGVVWDLMTGKIGYKNRDGEIVSLDGNETDGFNPVINPFGEMSMELPAFAQNTPLDAVNIGDMILQDTKVGWVIEKKGKTVRLMRPNGDIGSFVPPKTTILDFGSGVMVVRSLVNMLPGGTTAGLQGMLLPLMMMGDGDLDLEKMLPFMLLSQGATPTAPDGTAAPNPFAGMMGGAGGGNFLQTMMLVQLLGKGKDGGGRKSIDRDDGRSGFYRT